MKRYLALDIGNVLCRIDFRRFTFAISEATNISTWEVGQRVNRSQKMRDVGLLDMKDVLASEFQIKSSVIMDKILTIWDKEVVVFDWSVLDFFEKLYDDDNQINIALLSNVGTDHAKLINRFFNTEYTNMHHHGIFKNSIKYFSCDVGVRKPQSLYYQSFLQRYPEFTGCVYLDDLSDNLITSKEFGFNAVQFDLDKINSKKECEAMLKQIGNMILEPQEEKNSRRH